MYRLEGFFFFVWDWSDSEYNEKYKCHWREQQISNADPIYEQK